MKWTFLLCILLLLSPGCSGTPAQKMELKDAQDALKEEGQKLEVRREEIKEIPWVREDIQKLEAELKELKKKRDALRKHK